MATHSAAQRQFIRETAMVNGVHVTMLTAGVGQPLVLFHGAGTFHGFDFALPWASKNRVIVPYHPGWGESGDAPELATLQDYVLHYLDLFDQLELRHINLVGFSLGGLLAAYFAIGHSDRLRKVVLVAPAGMDVSEHPTANISAIRPEELPEYLAEDQTVVTRHIPAEPDPEFIAARQREMGNLFRILRSGPFDSVLRQWLHRITVPTMIVWGETDRLIPVQQADAWAKLIPEARVRRFASAGHLVLDEKREAVDTISEFLA